MPAALTHADARRAQNDAIRTLYEDTLVPVREIARIAGVTERNIYALVRRLGCRPRVRLASGGGRRIVPLASSGKVPSGLDAESVNRALQRCMEAVSRAERLTDAARAAKEERAATGRALRSSETQARMLLLIVQAMDLLAARTDDPDQNEVSG
jgi:hypothetical protein